MGRLFLQDLMILICAHTTLTHFSVPCFVEFFKHFKHLCRLNINRKRIPIFWSKRIRTFCAEFLITWLGHNEIILELHSFRPYSTWFFKNIFHIAWIWVVYCSIYFCKKITKSLNCHCRLIYFHKKSVVRTFVIVK